MMGLGSVLSPALPGSDLIAASCGKIAQNSLLEDMIKQQQLNSLLVVQKNLAANQALTLLH